MSDPIRFGNRTLPVHVPFHKSTARFRVAFGAAGSGKSYAGCDEAIAWALEEPGIVGMISRQYVTDLKDSTERVFIERMPAGLLDQCKLTRSGGHYECCVFPNGSEVWFRGLDEWEKKKSVNLGFLFMDEMTQFGEDTFHGMRTRLRQADRTAMARRLGYTTPITRQGLWGATNPAGKDWVYRLFHPDSSTRFKNADAFFSTTLDNPFLPTDYVDDMLNMPRPYVLRYVLCQFDDFAGRIYEEFGQQGTIVAPPYFDPDHPGPVVWMGMDPGTQNPTAGVWAHVDIPNNRLVAIAEYRHADLAADVHAANWRQIERMHRMNVQWRVADANAVTQRSRETLQKLSSAYGRMGYHFALGASDRDTRIWQLGRLIHLRRFVVSENCPMLIESLKDYQWKDLTPAARARGEEPREEPLKKDTDLVEAAQFLAGRMLPLPERPWALKRPENFAEEVWQEIREQRMNPRGSSIHNDLGISV